VTPQAMGSDTRAYLGLGSNLGDRLANLQRAVDLLGSVAGIGVVRSSRVYETAPVGPPQPDYLNAVIEMRTTLGARELLAAGLSVERDMGRVRGERWGARVIDIDLLNYGRDTFEEPNLTIPHPRMHERAFVMVPLLELEADPLLPGERSPAGLRLNGAGRSVRLFAPPVRIGGRGTSRRYTRADR